VDYILLGNNGNVLVTYQVGFTPRGVALVQAWQSGRRDEVRAALDVR
jgi:hypothetical protein